MSFLEKIGLSSLGKKKEDKQNHNRKWKAVGNPLLNVFSETQQSSKELHHRINSNFEDYEEGMFLPEESLKVSQLVIKNNPFLSWMLAGVLGILLLFIGVFTILYTKFALWYIGATTIILGLVMVFSARSDKFVFDARKGMLVFTQVGLFTRSENKYWLYEIQDVVLTELRDVQGGNDYELHICMRSGKRLPVLAGHVIGVARGAKFQAKEAIIEFLLNASNEEGASGSGSGITFDSDTLASHRSSSTFLSQSPSTSLGKDRGTTNYSLGRGSPLTTYSPLNTKTSRKSFDSGFRSQRKRSRSQPPALNSMGVTPRPSSAADIHYSYGKDKV